MRKPRGDQALCRDLERWLRLGMTPNNGMIARVP